MAELDARGELAALRPCVPPPAAGGAVTEEIEALELVRRVAASEVGDGTLVAVEMAVDELASVYARTRPADLLPRIRRHLGYVAALMDVRMTLDERRRLTVVGGWLSFLAATCDIDRGEDLVAGARPRTAVQLAEHADHPEILVGAGDPRLAAAHGGELPGGGPPGAGSAGGRAPHVVRVHAGDRVGRARVGAARPGARAACRGSACAGGAYRAGGGGERAACPLALLEGDAGDYGCGGPRRAGGRCVARGLSRALCVPCTATAVFSGFGRSGGCLRLEGRGPPLRRSGRRGRTPSSA
ncbi:hypothetical protein SAMN04489713_11876 [Actinomadura madurae]|uniref:Uncharacterized protein n=1 Tax=Actinomadura madurae TaxID=1993 RepID=A0A1I5TPP3_9ACTN|nr:hypothetical protein SAMN04489713_11876 [Actinomadura madurae]SPT51655.1 Uncharacterised protein [Actinomadura madurae]